jgi:hypothetical protein
VSRAETQPSQASLIEALVADLKSVRPVRLAGAYALALAMQFGFVAIAALLMGIDPVALIPMFSGPMGALLVVLVAGAVSCGLVAVRMSVPGRYVSPYVTGGLALLPIVLSVLVFAVSSSMPDWDHYVAHFVGGLGCLGATLKMALPAWVLSILLLRRLAPIGPTAVGLFAGLTALLQGALLVQLTCPITEPFHLALTHYAPLIFIAAVASAASGWLLRIVGRTPTSAA